MEGDRTLNQYKVGDAVRAFHPGMFGVVKDGRIVKIGRKYVHIDFGIWGVAKVLPRYITGEVYDWRN